MMPGNFVQNYAAVIASAHHLPYNTVLLRLEKVFGKPEPIPVQFWQYLQQVFLSFPPNFGPSFQYYPLPAWTIVALALQWTLLLLGVSQAIAWVASVFIGVYLALHKNKLIDKFLQPALYFLNSIPPFWLGLMFIFIFAIDMHFLPPGQAYDVFPAPYTVLVHMVLPLSVIVLTSAPSHIMVARSAAIDVIGSDFVQATKAQGLSQHRLLMRVLRNSFIPSMTHMFLTVGSLIGGIITVEYTFSYPGMGTVIANSVAIQDYPVMQAAFYVVTIVVLVCNLAADLAYPIIDPRVSYVE